MTHPVTPAVPTFSTLGIAPKLLTILEHNKFLTPTPIQARAIPVALEGKDVVGIAQTGTGKTLAFGVPMIQRLAQNKGQGLVLVPTRELALQVEETLHKVGREIGLKTAVIIGGASMHAQIQQLRRSPHIIVATPGRLMDHLKRNTVSLKLIQVLVLDEADRMFDIGFAPQIKQILSVVPKTRQTMLFSATMPPEIASLAAHAMTSPTKIEVSPAGTTVKKIEQAVYMVRKEQKVQLLEQILGATPGTVLVFSRTKYGAKKIAAAVRAMKYTAAEIHSNRSLNQRKDALEGFKTNKYRVLVATDIAARGIDVAGISLVINFDLPDNPEDYVHRIGRTGRAGLAGKAVSFVEPEKRSELINVQRVIRMVLPILPVPTLPPHRIIPHIAHGDDDAGGRRPWRTGNSKPVHRPSAPRPGNFHRTGSHPSHRVSTHK